MAERSRTSIIRDIKIVLDENERTFGSLDLGGDIKDPDQLETDTLISRLIHVAIDAVNGIAPIDLLEGGFERATSEALEWRDYNGTCVAATLPPLFTRLVYVRLGGWLRGTSTFLSEDDPLYAEFFSRYVGVRPTRLYPKAAIIPNDEGGLDVVCCPKPDGTDMGSIGFVRAADDEEEALSYTIADKCYWSVIYYAAHLYYTTLNEADRAAAMLNESYRRMNVEPKVEKGDVG